MLGKSEGDEEQDQHSQGHTNHTNVDEDEGETIVVKYADDVNVVELLDLERATSLFSVRKELKTIRSVGTEAVIYNIKENGKEIGMVINEKKTQSICISACNYHDVRSEIHMRCALISNNATLKVLGFVFDNHPTVSAHIENVSIKFSRSMWAIIHLKRAMIENGPLVEIYKSSLRPILEFCSVVYYSMISKEQSEALECLQRRVLRVIYGFKVSMEECFEKSGLEILECRRLKRIRKFAVKAAADENFLKKWFPT